MKVLWFTLTPCGASEKLELDSQGGGWLSALEKRMVASGEVELHVCFHCNTDIPSFTCKGTSYHPIRRIRMRHKFSGNLVRGGSLQDPIQSYAEVIRRVQPDLIHVHGTEEDFGLVQSVTDIPVVLSIQGILTNIISKYFSGVSFTRLLLKEKILEHFKLKSVLANYYIFKENAKREKVILSKARHIIGRTQWDRRSAAVLAPNAVYHHGDEILRDPFYIGEWTREHFASPLRIVTVSSVAPYKGYETILKVSRVLHDHGLNFEWRVIGLSPEGSFVKVVHKWLGQQEEVQLLGSIPGDEVGNILLNSDIYCQVSHIENSPNSLCEAMLVGMPIVASFAGGTDSLLRAGEEGVLVQDGDPWSMAGAILEMSQNFKKAIEMGQAARTTARVRHNPDRILENLLATYKAVIQDGGNLLRSGNDTE